MFSQNNQSLPQWLTTYHTLYRPNKVKYSIGFGRQQVTINLTFIVSLQTCFGLFYCFAVAQAEAWCWLLFPQWKGGSQMFPRKDVCQRLMQECRFPGKPKKSFFSAWAPDKLTQSWPHYCHDTLGCGCHCLISNSTEYFCCNSEVHIFST